MTQTEALYRGLIERIPAVTYATAPDGTPLYISPQIEELFGCSQERWMDRLGEWEDRIHPDDRERVISEWQEALANGLEYQDEYRVLLPGGDLRWVLDHAMPVFDEQGHAQIFQGVISDVTDRHRADAAERQADGRLRQMLGAIPLAAVIEDTRGRIIYCNRHLVDLIGRPEESIVGARWLDTVSPADRRELESNYYEQLHHGTVMPYSESEIAARDGRRRRYGWWTAPLRNEEGRVWGAASIGLDITEYRRSEEALRQSEMRRRRVLGMVLRAEDAERSRIAGELHDDTVQVLTATLVSLDRLMGSIRRGEGAVDVADIERVRAVVYEATERTRRLMFELRPQLLEAHGLRVAVEALLEEAAGDTRAEHRVIAPDKRFPAPIEDMAYRVVRETLANVRKHAQATHVEVELEEVDGMLAGRVSDDGRGFDPDAVRDRPRAYLHLGLDAVSERLWLAGGSFDLETVPGGGTTVRFSIPLDQGQPRSA